MPTETLRPNAAGTYTGIVHQTPATGAHWDKVDDNPDPDWNDTTVWSAALPDPPVSPPEPPPE